MSTKKIIFSTEQEQDIISRANAGTSALSIGKIYNVSNKTIGRLLEKYGMKTSIRKHKYDENIFDNIDTAEKAYWLGFITGDGYVNEDRGFLRIKLQGSDRHHLVKFITFLGGTEAMIKSEIHNTTGNQLYYAETNSRKLTNSLIKHNIRQCKSTKEQLPDHIPEEFIKDYIRGLIDADGHIGPHSLDLVNSTEVLAFVQKYLNKKCNTNIGKITNHCTTYRIYICRNRIDVLFHLYYENCIALDRKLKTFHELIGYTTQMPS